MELFHLVDIKIPVQVRTHELEDVDVDIQIKAPGSENKIHLDSGGVTVCRGAEIKSYAFDMPRKAIIKAYIEEVILK